MRQIALAFHKWMIKNKWKLHSSGEYYFVDDGQWPPNKILTEKELLAKFFD